MPLSSEDLIKLSRLAIDSALEAGRFIASRSGENITVEHKEGGDHIASQVVTEVDYQSNDIIIEGLSPSCKEYDLALLTEEGADDLRRLEKPAFWCVDPLDGTLSFTESVPGYSVSIALVSRQGVPLIGVIYNPVTRKLYSAVRGQGAMLDGERWRPDLSPPYTGRPLTAVFDPSMEESCANYAVIMERLEVIAEKMGLSGVQTMHRGGAVVNACRVLENSPACYFKFPKPADGGGSLWDFAASACIYNELGAIATDFHGEALELNRAESTFMNHRGVMYATSKELAVEVRQWRIDS
ncbi:MAG: inositol monophosphatase [Proteobacteria bacterium]|nr:inositol monophosphatase [Pseudomonadota bacterium]